MFTRAIGRVLLAALALGVSVGTASPLQAQTATDDTAAAPGSRPRADIPEDRYALAGGCYAMRPDGGAPYYFKATDLGRYLLFGTAGTYLSASEEQVVDRPTPNNDSDWVVSDLGASTFALRLTGPDRTLVAQPGGALRVVAGTITDATARFTFRRSTGCATFPEVDINVTGPYSRGASPIEEVRGYLDGHLHMMTFEFLGGRAHCGRPWHRYGVTLALVDCPDHMIANGAGAVMENLLSHEIPVATHDPVGWPTFKDWPAPGSLTHEQVYYRWLERAWRGGLRMFVNMLTENAVLCNVYPLKQNSCNEMDSVRLQLRRIRELERYIDAQSGGPGRGWFRIVTDPFEARRVMNDGRLAVVLGIETSEPFGCRSRNDQPQCTATDIDRELAEVHAMGVRHLLLLNKFDNALAGVAGDGGVLGAVINVGNANTTGHYWDMHSCDPDDTGVHDNNQLVLPGVPSQDALFGAVLQPFTPPAAAPLYPPPPHCNSRGLTDLGQHAIEQIMERGMVFDPDHLSVLARQQSLDVLEQHHYPGVVSSHSWATPDAYPRIYALGGMTTPYAGGSSGFVSVWRERRKYAPPGRACFGIGYGADANGLGGQGGPRGLATKNPVRYPFTGLGGVSIAKQVSGQRVYDINVDGVAQYGLYPDWIEDLRQLAGQQIVDDMQCGADAYLQMWERAGGIPGERCRPAAEFDALPPRVTVPDVLRRVGQPHRRQGSTFTYCVSGGGTRVLAFDANGRLAGAPSLAVTTPLPATGHRSLPWPLVGATALAALLLRRRARSLQQQ